MYKKYYDFYRGVVWLNISPMTIGMFEANVFKKIWLVLNPKKDITEKGYHIICDDGFTWWIREKDINQFELVKNQ